MSIKDKLKQQSSQQQQIEQQLSAISERLSNLNRSDDQFAQQLKELTSAVNTLATRVQELESTSTPSQPNSSALVRLERRLHGIENAVGAMSKLLAESGLDELSSKARQANYTALKDVRTATDELKKISSSVKRVTMGIDERVASRLEHLDERTERALAGVVDGCSSVVNERLDASNDRADKLMRAAHRLEQRQLWGAVGAMAAVLIPAAIVVAGIWMVIAGIIVGARWASSIDAEVPLVVGAWALVALAIGGALFGLYELGRRAVWIVEDAREERQRRR